MKKSYITAALALTSCMVIGAAAANQSQNITATFRPDMELTVNGTSYTVRDTTGVKVSPLIYNGTTYLPLSSLSQLLGVDISWDADTQTVMIQDEDTDYIGGTKAQEIALKHARLSERQVSFLRTTLDWEDGRPVYEVEFCNGNTEYDYEIDAVTGAVISHDLDIEHGSTPPAPNKKELISREKAQKLAQSKAPNATLVELELDDDDGRAVYEGKLQDGNIEYEFEIDAVSGKFIQWSKESD